MEIHQNAFRLDRISNESEEKHDVATSIIANPDVYLDCLLLPQRLVVTSGASLLNNFLSSTWHDVFVQRTDRAPYH